MRSEKEARQISADVSRYLYFARPEALHEEYLIDSQKMNEYLQSLEPALKPSTQNAKLNRIRQGIHFLALRLDSTGLLEVQRVEGLIKNWSAVLARSARTANRERLEDKSGEPADFGDVDAFLASSHFHRLSKGLIADVKAGKPVDPAGLRDVQLWLMGCLLHANSQRPGAVANMTIRQCKKGTTGKSTGMILVTKHKTGTTGSAMITVKAPVLGFLVDYLEHLRPLLPECELAFPNSRGKPFDHLSRQVKQLGDRFGLTLPTATEARHAAATATAKKCTDQERDAVATTMSHSRQTQMAYYVNLKCKEEAERGFDILQGLRQGQKATSATKSRVQYTPDEVETIALYFENYILNYDEPSAYDCREFLNNHPMNREPKQVRDKVRQLIKKAKQEAQH